jgi:hypothetical protein
LGIYRVEVFEKRHWWSKPAWHPLRVGRFAGMSYGQYVWEGSLTDALRREQNFIRYEWEAIYREEGNWITVMDKEQV